jgi:hypothetical protein
MRLTNRTGLPEAFVLACDSARHNAPGSVSATTLLKGAKEIILTERHWEELTEDVADRIWAIWGTAVHSILERETPDTFVEEYLTAEVEGLKITGRVDNYNMRTGDIEDYKTASTWKVVFGDFADWHKQGMIYAWLMKQAGLPVRTVRFIALLKDHSKTKAKRDAGYPQSPVYNYFFMPSEESYKNIESFIKKRVDEIMTYSNLLDNDIPECSPEERWAKETKWAVMKKGRKAAVKLHDSKESATEHASDVGGYVEKREGESTKCMEYCPCADFCNFYKSIKDGE